MNERGQSTASLDDLLRYEEEPKRVRRADPTRVWVGKTLGVAAAVSVLVILVFQAFLLSLPLLLVFPAVLAFMLLRRVLRDLDVVAMDRMPLRPANSTVPVTDGLFAAAARWDTRLSWTHNDPARFSRTVQPLIAELANERLRQRHNCTLRDDPVRAHELLGTPLWTFLTTPVTRALTPRELAAIVAKLEGL